MSPVGGEMYDFSERIHLSSQSSEWETRCRGLRSLSRNWGKIEFVLYYILSPSLSVRNSLT